MEKLQDILNDWLKENQTDIEYKFKEDNLFEDESIKNMRLIFYHLKKVKHPKENELELCEKITLHIVEYLKKDIEMMSENKSYSRYEITPEMLEYKGYNNTKFKNIEGLYGLMQMN